MSLYNMINRVTPATFFVMPMLGKHPDKYPRFRDCFISDEESPQYDNHIHIYTRTGGGNRDSYTEENQTMRDMDGFVADFDDSFDSTFASWIFKIPEQWAADFDLFQANKMKDFSAEYRTEMCRVFPKLADKFDKLFAA